MATVLLPLTFPLRCCAEFASTCAPPKPPSQIPPDSDPSDPQFFKDKAERAGKVVSDTLTTSSEEAAADPNNLKGKSSDNKPDGLVVSDPRRSSLGCKLRLTVLQLLADV